MPFLPRKFAYKHPLFGRSKIEQRNEKFKNSIYYLWWEFLRRSTAYRRCCEAGGTGELAAIYADFGDVFADDFKTWWTTEDRGVRLFAEQVSARLEVITEMPSSGSDQVLVVQVPLTLPKRFLSSQFQKLLDQHHTGKRGKRHNAASSAMYPVTGHVDIVALQKCLRVYDTKRANPGMPLWQVAQDAKAVLASNFVKKGDTKAEVTSKKFVLANTAKRLLKKAELVIEGVEAGKFPVLKD